jgi:hypothetical protein
MNLKISIFIDTENQLPYVLHYNKRLYFSRNMDNTLITETYKSLLAEQDEQSAHRYVDSYERFNGKFLLDIGAAEGIISLEVIELVKFVYLFECSPDWIEALEATFAPYKDKVEIINKYVSDEDNTNCITLDTFFKDKPFDDLFIKMDIERVELRALHGANFVLRNAKNLDFSVCIYHNSEDEITIPYFLKSCGYECVMSPGFLLIGDWWLRKGIVRKLRKIIK